MTHISAKMIYGKLWQICKVLSSGVYAKQLTDFLTPTITKIYSSAVYFIKFKGRGINGFKDVVYN